MCWVSGNSGCFVSGKFGFDASPNLFFLKRVYNLKKTCLQRLLTFFKMPSGRLYDVFWKENLLGLWKETLS